MTAEVKTDENQSATPAHHRYTQINNSIVKCVVKYAQNKCHIQIKYENDIKRTNTLKAAS